MLHFSKYSIAFLSVSDKLFLGNLFSPENVLTTSILTASINVSTAWWFFLGSQLALLLLLSYLFASLVSCFCSSLLWKNAFNLTFMLKLSKCFFKNFLKTFVIVSILSFCKRMFRKTDYICVWVRSVLNSSWDCFTYFW